VVNNIVPFGKYKDQPVEVLAQDREYTDWLMGQSWFKDRYQNIYTLIINNFTEPSETPEHNALQALFLDDVFAQWVVFLCYRKMVADAVKDWEDRRDSHKRAGLTDYPDELVVRWEVQFEVNGADVLIWCIGLSLSFKVEIKPAVGDDYPAIIRQMRNIRAPGSRILLLYRYTGIGATYEQVVEIFSRSNIKVVTLSEVMAAMEAGNDDG